MSPWRRTGHRGRPVLRVEAPESMVQIHLEELGRHAWDQALLGAVIGSEDGPPFRFVAAPPDPAHDASEHTTAAAGVPLALAHQRLDELEAELVALGWRRRPDRGPHWWSRRYDPPARPRA